MTVSADRSTRAGAGGGGVVPDSAVVRATPEFEALAERVRRSTGGDRLSVGGLWGASQAWVLDALTKVSGEPWLVLLSDDTEAERFVVDLETLGARPVLFPARETGFGGPRSTDPESIKGRLQVAQLFAGPPERRPRLVVASLLSMLQPVPSPNDLADDFLHLATGQKLVAEDLLERLIATGYTRQPLAERPGELSLRGDILDVFPFAADLPLRIELFDDEIDSLRTFEPESQRSVERVEQLALCIASDAGGVEDGKGIAAIQMLATTTICAEIEPLRIEERAEGLRIQSSAHANAISELWRALEERRRVVLQSLPGDTLNFATKSVQSLALGMREAPRVLNEEVAAGENVLVLCANEAERARFAEILTQRGVPVHGGAPGAAGGVSTAVGTLSRGFRLPAAGLVVLHHRELVGLVGARKPADHRTKHRVRALESFFELRAGDLVVHAVHGVARYVGLKRIERSGAEEEHLHLIFADEVTIYVPAARIDLVQRYVGSGSASPELDKIGSQAFRKRKEKVERALVDLAAELLEIQAKRELRSRDAWAPDADLVQALVEAFPFVDTPDQATTDAEIDRDLRSKKPMDRLLCGDVGFGKTELAVRAAFRVVSGGGQVAVLVPTTVLAQQHYETFRERVADFPVEVGVLSRYVTGKQAKETIARAARGEIDILIGTHRILSKDVALPKLGLVIVDEEQRFGVTHKEHFKKLRAQIDILTLTATPIPRTLHMSLSGLRDISALTEPPPGRQEIDTSFLYAQELEKMRAVLLREKNRGGQTFFLHNRVQSIERRARELQALVPECTFAIGHGQMTGKQLSEVMGVFTRGNADVLVATTIVENGIDIPTAGTILIDDADHFGLSELHQLRGRVGRGNHKGYCYLVIDRTRPIRDAARERLKALEELTQLGAGFQISMKDLEIRGAGNILGSQQSGHIAAVGYDMYCRLLKQTVERMHDEADLDPKSADWETRIAGLLKDVPREVTDELEATAVELELGIRSFLPREWIPEAASRLELLRHLNGIAGDDDAREALSMMRDRYGRVPTEAEALVRQFALRARLIPLTIRKLLWREDTYFLQYKDRVLVETVLGPQGVELRPLRAGQAHLVIPPKVRTPEAALAWFEGLLTAPNDAHRPS